MLNIQRKIISFPPIVFAIRKSKLITLPGFHGLNLFSVVKFFFQQINKTGLNERASAISFNLIMAIPAACIFLFTLVPYLPVSKQFNTELLKLAADLTPNKSTYFFIKDFLDDFFGKPRNGLLSFGFLLVIYYASNAMIGLIRTFDRSITENRTFIFHQRWRAIQLTLIMILLIMASILVLLGQEQLVMLIKKAFHIKRRDNIVWLNAVRWLLIIVLIFYAIGLIYKFAPSVKKRWSIITPGSILATFLTLATTLLFSYWVNHFGNFNKVYGSIGTVLILMLLINLNSLILLIGFELNVSITYLKAEMLKNKEKEASYSSVQTQFT